MQLSLEKIWLMLSIVVAAVGKLNEFFPGSHLVLQRTTVCNSAVERSVPLCAVCIAADTNVCGRCWNGRTMVRTSESLQDHGKCAIACPPEMPHHEFTKSHGEFCTWIDPPGKNKLVKDAIYLYISKVPVGTSLKLSGSMWNLELTTFSNRVSSIYIAGDVPWELFSEVAFKGESAMFGPGKYESNILHSYLDGQVASVSIPDSMVMFVNEELSHNIDMKTIIVTKNMIDFPRTLTLEANEVVKVTDILVSGKYDWELFAYNYYRGPKVKLRVGRTRYRQFERLDFWQGFPGSMRIVREDAILLFDTGSFQDFLKGLIYKEAPPYKVKVSTPDLGDFKRKAVAVRVTGKSGWMAYTEAQYKGKSRLFVPGNYLVSLFESEKTLPFQVVAREISSIRRVKLQYPEYYFKRK